MNNSCLFPELNHICYKLSVKIQEASRPKILLIWHNNNKFIQITYSLQSLSPQLAKAIRGGYKRNKKIL